VRINHFGQEEEVIITTRNIKKATNMDMVHQKTWLIAKKKMK